MTFVDFLCAVASLRNWGESSHYAVLKQVEVFFEFIERRGDALPDSNKFRQPLLRHDYPRVGRSKGTKKRPIPRRAFKLFISYVESLVAIANVITDKALDGSLTTEQMSGFDRRYTTIDFQARQNDFGFIPVIFHEGRTFPVWRAQNVFNVGIKKIKGRGFKKVPHPHALNQLLVSLYTGLRQNHIQWLDRYRFDEHVSPEEVGLEFGQLFVNTDKVKERGWISFVNFRVIEILRSQRAWCDRIDEPGFNKEVFYNDNPESKWGSFFPLFSYSENGSPHSDALYSKCWLKLLTGLQDVLQTVGMFGIKLIRLLPVSIAFDDPEVEKKLREFGAGQRRLCAVICKSDISPHSARVSVVSHAIAILPADLIGRHWTGQSASTVFHYVVPDEDETFVEQQRQQLWVRQVGYDKGYEAMLKASPAQKGPFIKADAVNSNLSQSLRANPEETIAAYGLISLSFGEQSRSGIEILRETRGAGALEGKTEICPHGGICPPEVVAELKGWKRCGPCPRAVRSIDHLPAVTAKIRQVLEELTEFEVQIAHAESSQAVSDDELDALEGSRATKAEDMASWQMVAEVLETMRQRIASGISTKSWHVRQPEIVERHLRQVPFPTNATEYVLLRLQECEAFPMLESPQIRARFDMMRRHLLANTGNLREALRFEVCPNPGAECLGLLRSIVAANKLSIDDLKKMFESDYLEQMPPRPLRLLATESADTTQNEVLI